MQLDIQKSYNAHLFTPYMTHDRQYYLLFYENKLPGPFFVKDAPLVVNTMFYIGDVTSESYEGEVVGSIFYTQSPTICEGTFALAFSGLLKQGANSPRFRARDLGMELVLKTPNYYVYNKKNTATLLVCPHLKESIRKNFEV